MSHCRELFTNGGYYHVFNKTIDHKTPFLDQRNCEIFLSAAQYYRASDLILPFSQLKKLSTDRKAVIQQNIADENNFRIAVLEYCLMPNHYHFVLRQNHDNGVNIFMSNLINSFTRWYNKINQRKGPLFLTRFKAVPILGNEHLLTVCKYVNLNPLKSGVVESFEQLQEYPWSSYKDYFANYPALLTEKSTVLSLFNHEQLAHQAFIENLEGSQ